MGKPTRYGSRQQIKRKINMMRRNIDQAELHLHDIYVMVQEQKDPDKALFLAVLESLETEKHVLEKFKERLIG